MQDLLPVEGAYLESDGLVINSTLKSQLKTLPYDADDCIVNPDNCGSGLTVSFSAKGMLLLLILSFNPISIRGGWK